MTRSEVEKIYFEWLVSLVCPTEYLEGDYSFSHLLEYLHDVEFTYVIQKDANRAQDGLDLRYRFGYENIEIEDAERYLKGPCSVLELMVAIAVTCEEIMDDPEYGDRTGQWFWKMIGNLGLSGMYNRRFDENTVEDIIQRFLDRDYQPDGRGGLFIVKNCKRDLRNVELWTQMTWFLDTVLGYLEI